MTNPIQTIQPIQLAFHPNEFAIFYNIIKNSCKTYAASVAVTPATDYSFHLKFIELLQLQEHLTNLHDKIKNRYVKQVKVNVTPGQSYLFLDENNALYQPQTVQKNMLIFISTKVKEHYYHQPDNNIFKLAGTIIQQQQ